jgi:non-specific serine/threonine protein kinase/serine/threonine-protein kinase
MTMPESTPTTIGRYRITGTLGEGGMGTVYRAEQDQPSRTVALKVIRPDLVSPALARRFSRESEVLGRLQHPGIAQIYEAGTAEGPHGPQPYFAMELVSGVPLDEFSQDRRLDVSGRLELFVRICEAVHYAHQKGVIHRDLKPSNILVDATGQPKILDFGVARIADDETTGVLQTKQTTLGQLIGTLQYMSPEQVNADPVDIDIRSDVYSLGIILYQLLAERLPYDISRHVLHEAAWVILQVDPAPLSSVNRNLRGDVETIVAKALEKEKTRRYSSADELASDIRKYLKHEPISARPASTWYQVRKFAQRNKALVGGLTLAAAILVAGTVVSLLFAIRATKAERLAESRRAEAEASSQLAEQRRAETASALLAADSARGEAQREQQAAVASAARATREADKATSVNAILQDMLASPDPDRSRGEKLTVRDVLDQVAGNPELYDRNDQPEVRAAVDATIGRTYMNLALFEQARQHLDSAYNVRRRTLGPSSLDVATSAEDRGTLAKTMGDPRTAEPLLLEAMAIRRKQLPPDDDRITRLMSELAYMRYTAGDISGAERMYREALRLAIQRHGDAGIYVSARRYHLGRFLLWNRRPAEAIPLLEASLKTVRATYGDTYSSTLSSMLALADAKKAGTDYKGAELLYRECLAISKKLYGEEHVNVASVEINLAEVLGNLRKLEEADTLMTAGINRRIRLLGEPHFDVALGRTALARLRQQQSRFPAADTLLRQALAGRRAALGDSTPAAGSSLNDIGYNLQLMGKWAEAEQSHRQALVIFRRVKGLEREETDALAHIGWTLSKQPGKLAEADSILGQALHRRRAQEGEGTVLVGDTYEKLAGIAVARNELARAESLTVAGLEIRRKVYGPKSPSVAGQLLNVAFMREKLNDTAGAIPALREALAITLAVRPATDPTVLYNQMWLATDLCMTGKVLEGETMLRDAIPNVPADTTRTMPWRLRSSLALCLAKQNRFEEGDSLVVTAADQIQRVPNASAEIRAQVLARAQQFYTLWGKPERAAELGRK